MSLPHASFFFYPPPLPLLFQLSSRSTLVSSCCLLGVGGGEGLLGSTGGGRRSGGCVVGYVAASARRRYAPPPRHTVVSAAVAACSVIGEGVGLMTYLYSCYMLKTVYPWQEIVLVITTLLTLLRCFLILPIRGARYIVFSFFTTYYIKQYLFFQVKKKIMLSK